jgi:putative intracellular protease/amidase
MTRFKKDKAAQEALANTVKLSSVKSEDVEDELLRLGAIFEKVRNWEPFSIVDGRLVTGQNPASAGEFRRDQKAILTPQELAKQMEEVAARQSGYVK